MQEEQQGYPEDGGDKNTRNFVNYLTTDMA
jgi:hypothetical protein